MFLGALIFMISDFCIGINQFYTELQYAQVNSSLSLAELTFMNGTNEL
jgi:hypothetical protein